MFCCSERDDGSMGPNGIPNYTKTLTYLNEDKIPTIEKTDYKGLNQVGDSVLVEVYYVSLTSSDKDDVAKGPITPVKEPASPEKSAKPTLGGLPVEKTTTKPKLGHDFSGKVREAGEKSGFAKGDLVFGWVQSGAFSDFIEVPVKQLTKVPNGVSLEAASSLPYAAFVANKAFKDLKADEKVHVNSKGYLADFLTAVAGKTTKNVTVHQIVDGKEKIPEGKYDVHIEGVNKNSTGGFSRGFGLGESTGNNLSALKYQLSADEFSTLVPFITSNVDVITPLKHGKESVVETGDFEKDFSKHWELLKAGNTEPHVFQVQGLLTKLAASEKDAKAKVEKEAKAAQDKVDKETKEAKEKTEKDAKAAEKTGAKDAKAEEKALEAESKEEKGFFSKTWGSVTGLFSSEKKEVSAEAEKGEKAEKSEKTEVITKTTTTVTETEKVSK